MANVEVMTKERFTRMSAEEIYAIDAEGWRMEALERSKDKFLYVFERETEHQIDIIQVGGYVG